MQLPCLKAPLGKPPKILTQALPEERALPRFLLGRRSLARRVEDVLHVARLPAVTCLFRGTLKEEYENMSIVKDRMFGFNVPLASAFYPVVSLVREARKYSLLRHEKKHCLMHPRQREHSFRLLLSKS